MRLIVLVLAGFLVAGPAPAKFKHFQRSYRNARAVDVRHGSRSLRVMPDHERSAYRERRFLVFPAKRHSQAYKGLQKAYLWDREWHHRITFVDGSRQINPTGTRVNGFLPVEIDVGPPVAVRWDGRRWTLPAGTHGPLYEPRLYHQAQDPRSRPKPSDWTHRKN